MVVTGSFAVSGVTLLTPGVGKCTFTHMYPHRALLEYHDGYLKSPD